MILPFQKCIEPFYCRQDISEYPRELIYPELILNSKYPLERVRQGFFITLTLNGGKYNEAY